MTFVTILRDNREQKPYEFAGYSSVNIKDVTLETGDYTLPEFCRHNEDTDTYYPVFAVERKAGQDLVSSISQERERFKNEIKRAGDWREPLRVVIEEPWETFREERKFMQYRNVHPRQIEGTIDAWEKHFNAKFSFHSDRQDAEREAVDTLFGWYRKFN
jgi:ERCC4-type nuclease